jgi:hypothetical protein
MIDQKTAFLIVDYTNLQSYEFNEANFTIINAKFITQKTDNPSKRSFSLSIDGTAFYFPSRKSNLFLLDYPQSIYTSCLDGQASIIIYE